MRSASGDVLTVVSWLWGRVYTREHWNIFRKMFSANCTVPHRFRLVTDRCKDATDIDERMLARAVGWVPPTRGCLRRLSMLSADMHQFFGSRFLHVDLDTVILRNIDHLITEDDFRISRCVSRGPRGYAYGPGIMLMTAGAMDHVWQRVKGNSTAWMRMHNEDGWRGTDQAVMGPFLEEAEVAVWRQEDGVYSYRDEVDHETGILPDDAAIMQLYGPYDPMQMKWPWIKDHYLCHR